MWWIKIGIRVLRLLEEGRWFHIFICGWYSLYRGNNCWKSLHLEGDVERIRDGVKFKSQFSQSCFIGINLPLGFMEMTCNFFHYSEGSIPFTYLDLSVGANSRKLFTWEPLLEKLRNRLNSWRNKYVSFGRRIILLNLGLNAVQIFYLSFLKMSTRIVRILRLCLGVWREEEWRAYGVENIRGNREMIHIF